MDEVGLEAGVVLLEPKSELPDPKLPSFVGCPNRDVPGAGGDVMPPKRPGAGVVVGVVDS